MMPIMTVSSTLEMETIVLQGCVLETTALTSHGDGNLVMIMDVLMPVMGGIDLVKAIRAKNLDIPVVLLVTGQSDLNEQSALALGAAGLVHKPYNIGVLLERINECLKKIKVI